MNYRYKLQETLNDNDENYTLKTNRELKNIHSGKSFSQMIQLKMNLEKGLKCAVVALNSEKIKKDFEYITGVKLNLDPCDGCKDVYNASLNVIS